VTAHLSLSARVRLSPRAEEEEEEGGYGENAFVLNRTGFNSEPVGEPLTGPLCLTSASRVAAHGLVWSMSLATWAIWARFHC
jgi:hypothetical protein